jgi:hypothetical protein
MVQLMKKCMSQPEAQSIGGACKIDHYLKWTFENVGTLLTDLRS